MQLFNSTVKNRIHGPTPACVMSLVQLLLSFKLLLLLLLLLPVCLHHTT
jgi:hypothetical protein